MRALWLLLILMTAIFALFLIGCGDSSDDDDDSEDSGQDDDDSDDDDAVDDDDSGDDDDLAPRSFQVAAAPMQYKIGDWYIETTFDFDGFEGMVDLVSMHQDFFGVPWDELLAGQPLPDYWITEMTQIRDNIDELGAGVFLSLTPLGGLRDRLAPKPIWKDDHMETEDWSEGCFDFSNSEDGAAYTAAYFDYVDWMIDLFKPQYLATVIEMNMFEFYCPDDWPALVAMQNDLYDHIKQLYPDLPVFPTFVLEQAWGIWGGCELMDEACLQEKMTGYAAIKKDRFGVSDYPLHKSNEWDWMPDEYFTKVEDLAGVPLVVGETGYPNQGSTIPQPEGSDTCIDLLQSNDTDQARYMDQLFTLAQEREWDLVTWWSLRDYLPADIYLECPCSFDTYWCILYDMIEEMGLLGAWLGWGAMGVLDFDGNEKPVMDTWEKWIARPVQ